MKKTAGFSSLIIFLKVESFGLRPAEFSPTNLNDLTRFFLLFCFPLLPFLFPFFVLIFTSFLGSVLPDSLILTVGVEMEASGSPEPPEKPTPQFYCLYLHFHCYPH